MIHKFEGVMLAISPIFHGGDEKTGSTPVLRSITIFNEKKGEFQKIYHVSGNSVRGKLRRALMYDFFQQIGKPAQEVENLKVYHLFFGGGKLESSDKDTGVIDLEIRRKIRSIIPPLALFGSAVKNQMIPGILKNGHAFPICLETLSMIPEKFHSLPQAQKSIRTFTDTSFFTRRDDLQAEREDDEQAIQMKVDYEVFIPGTAFYHWFALEHPNELELSTFGHMMELFGQSPFLGGKSSTGDGEVTFRYEPELPSGELYRNFLQNSKNQILELLEYLEGNV